MTIVTMKSVRGTRGDRQKIRKGYALESLSALISILHERYPDREFICFTEPENQASIALLGKLGYRDMGYLDSVNSEVFGRWVTKRTEDEIAGKV